jgi:hypothetical protein
MSAAVGSEDGMAKLIMFYVPDRFKGRTKWIPQELRGKVLEFPVEHKKSA